MLPYLCAVALCNSTGIPFLPPGPSWLLMAVVGFAPATNRTKKSRAYDFGKRQDQSRCLNTLIWSLPRCVAPTRRCLYGGTQAQALACCSGCLTVWLWIVNRMGCRSKATFCLQVAFLQSKGRGEKRARESRGDESRCLSALLLIAPQAIKEVSSYVACVRAPQSSQHVVCVTFHAPPRSGMHAVGGECLRRARSRTNGASA